MVLKDSNGSPDRFRLRGFHPLCRGFPDALRLTTGFVTPWSPCRTPVAPYNPRPATTAVYHTDQVWADPLSLATTQGMISFPGGT